jgi:3-hydroxymyristoyl/3-hydroxydecanoyl-(acyl carrier protein) dehydratase
MPVRTESLPGYAAEHPAFAGHFPGRPIVPGVLLLDAALHVAGADAATGAAPLSLRIAQAKFVRPIPPGVALQVIIETTIGNVQHCSVCDANGQVASVQWRAVEPGP